MSMISELVDSLRTEAKSMGTYGTDYMATLLMRSADAIEMLSEKVREQGWIPCSERLPNKYKTVLTTSKDGRVRENFINAGGWSYDTYAVVAWTPLPEPWEGEEDE